MSVSSHGSHNSSTLSVLIRPKSAASKSPDFWRKQSFISPQVPNPFYFKLHLAWFEWIKVLLMSITIAPVRLIAIVLVLLTAVIVASFATMCRSHKRVGQPLQGCRKLLVVLSCCLVRLCFFIAGFMWVRVIGRRSSSTECPILVAAPHTSFFDGLLPYSVPSACLSVLTRQENVDMPFIGPLVSMTQPIVVNRLDDNSRQHTIELLKERSSSSSSGWPQILIFPEGTCTNGMCLINFKVGAFAPGLSVQPVILRYPNRVKSTIWTEEGNNIIGQLWITLCQFYTNATIEYLPVCHPDPHERSDPKFFANMTRQLMAEHAHLPLTDHSYEDCRLMKLAEEYDLPTCSGIVEFSKLSRKLNLKYKDVEEMLVRFATLSRPMHGHITFPEFAGCLGLPETAELHNVFQLFDRDDSGTIDFREYIIGLSLIAPTRLTEDTVRLSFRLFDADGSGAISRESLSRLLTSAFGLTDEHVNRVLNELQPNANSGLIEPDAFVRYMNERPELARILTFLQSQNMKMPTKGSSSSSGVV